MDHHADDIAMTVLMRVVMMVMVMLTVTVVAMILMMIMTAVMITMQAPYRRGMPIVGRITPSHGNSMLSTLEPQRPEFLVEPSRNLAASNLNREP